MAEHKHEWHCDEELAWYRDFNFCVICECGAQLDSAEINRRVNAVTQLEDENEIFPMQDGPPITRKTAEMIYQIYSNLFGSSQSLDRLAERGGFGWAEVKLMVDIFIRKRSLKSFNQLKKAWMIKALGGE